MLDEPTNDLDMDTLDLLEDLLADYDGTLILVSHDRDFVDRLATSTIALDGRGDVVETPGGWSDFIRQNPGFFARRRASADGRAQHRSRAGAAAGAESRAKLSYKDQRRLEELEGPGRQPARRHRRTGGDAGRPRPLRPRPGRASTGCRTLEAARPAGAARRSGWRWKKREALAAADARSPVDDLQL